MSKIVVESVPTFKLIAENTLSNVESILKKAPKTLIKSYTELAFNVKQSNIPLSIPENKFIKSNRSKINTLASKSTLQSAKKRLLIKNPKVAIFLAKVCLPFLPSS